MAHFLPRDFLGEVGFLDSLYGESNILLDDAMLVDADFFSEQAHGGVPILGADDLPFAGLAVGGGHHRDAVLLTVRKIVVVLSDQPDNGLRGGSLMPSTLPFQHRMVFWSRAKRP